jgi:hypothetical protein
MCVWGRRRRRRCVKASKQDTKNVWDGIEAPALDSSKRLPAVVGLSETETADKVALQRNYMRDGAHQHKNSTKKLFKNNHSPWRVQAAGGS